MELAIAKTIAAFLNSRGGVLVIGANDAGQAVGLDRDLATLRTPDHDRFELWLRDMLSTALGRNAAALPRIVYLGGLGDERDDLSGHLTSRREVEKALREGPAALTAFRAAKISS